MPGSSRKPTAHDTQHTVYADWPLALDMDKQGRAIHVCVDCGTEVPDGVVVERKNGAVFAWVNDVDPDGKAFVRTVHLCKKSSGR